MTRHMLKASLLLSYNCIVSSFHYTAPPPKLTAAVLSLTSRKMSSTTAVVALNVKAVVKPAFREGLLEVLTKDAQQSRTVEPGCLQFMVGVDVNDENVLHLHEQYASEQALEFHNQMPHLKAVGEFVETNDALQDYSATICRAQLLTTCTSTVSFFQVFMI